MKSNPMSDQSAAPTFTYWHVYTDEEGVSHQQQCELSNFEKESIGGDADPQWNNHLLESGAKVLFVELPRGWVGDWHENPKPQWIVPLSGRWWVETMDGQRVEMGPGEFSFGGDQNCREDEQGRKGHKSGTAGTEPCRLMVFQLTDRRYEAAQPGDFS